MPKYLLLHPAGVMRSTCTLSRYCQSPVRIPLLHISNISANSLPAIRNHVRQEAALGDWLWRNIHAGLFLSDLEWRKVTFCTQPSWAQRKQRENNASPNGQWNVNILKARRKESCHMRRTNARPRSRLPYTHGQLINWTHAFQLAHLNSWSRKLRVRWRSDLWMITKFNTKYWGQSPVLAPTIDNLDTFLLVFNLLLQIRKKGQFSIQK